MPISPARGGLETRHELVDHEKDARRLERVEEERSEGHEQDRPRDRARGLRALKRTRHAERRLERLLGADGGRLGEEEDEAAAEARTLLRLAEGEGVPVPDYERR